MIDMSNWKEFKVSDVFITEKHGESLQTPTGSMMSKKELQDGNIPRVTVSNFNNGITGYYADSDNKNYRTYENFISVSFLGTVFYQPVKVSLDMKVHCLKPLNYALNVYSAGYIVSIIRKAISNYAYSDQLSSRVLAELEFKLPATSSGQPDWAYMESYMKKIMEKAEKYIEIVGGQSFKKHTIDVSEWGEMRIGDYFEVEYGTFRPKEKLGVGDYNYVTTSGFNNGITDKIDVADHQGGRITVASDGALMGSAFYQEEPFSTSNIVSTLTPFNKTPLNKYNAQFICSLIFSKRSEFGWLGFKFSVDRVRNLIVKVPVDTNGEPDWQYMENYMKKIFEKAEEATSMLQTIA